MLENISDQVRSVQAGMAQLGKGTTTILCGLLLAAHVVLVVFLVSIVAPTIDEPKYINVGRLIQIEGWEHELTWQHGPLPFYGNQLLQRSFPRGGVQPGAPDRGPLIRARLGTLPFSLLAAWLVFIWTRRACGRTAGLVCLGLYALNPLMIGYAGLALMDVQLCSMVLLVLYVLWRFLPLAPWRLAALLGVALGLALATKFLALLVLPPVLIAAGLRKQWRGRSAGPWRSGLAGAGLAVGVGGIALLTLHACYGLRTGRASSDPDDYDSELISGLVDVPVLGQALALLPAPYLRGIDFQKGVAETEFSVFLNGSFAPGHGDFYVWTLLYKTPELVLLLTGWLVVYLLLALRRRAPWMLSAAEGWTLWALLPSALVVFAYLSFFSSLQVGVRYVLVLYPLLFVLLGLLFTGRAPGLRSGRVLGALALLLVATQALALAGSWPNPIAYYNRISGGPSQAYRHFRKSNSDNGQFLETGLALLSQRESEPFDVLEPGAGARFGRVAASIHVLNLTDEDAQGRRTRPRFAWLESLSPVASVGAVWWLFDVNAPELEQAVAADPLLREDLILAYLGTDELQAAAPHLELLGAAAAQPLERLAVLVAAAQDPAAEQRLIIELCKAWIRYGRCDRALAVLAQRERLDLPARALLAAEAQAGLGQEEVAIATLEAAALGTWPAARLLARLYLDAMRFDDAREVLLPFARDERARRYLARVDAAAEGHARFFGRLR